MHGSCRRARPIRIAGHIATEISIPTLLRAYVQPRIVRMSHGKWAVGHGPWHHPLCDFATAEPVLVVKKKKKKKKKRNLEQPAVAARMLRCRCRHTKASSQNAIQRSTGITKFIALS